MMLETTEKYKRQMRAVNKTSLSYRQGVAQQWLEQSQYDASSTIIKRNRRLYDLVRMLRGDWEDEPDWSFTALDLDQANQLPDEVNPDIKARLKKSIEHAVSETEPTFEALKANENEIPKALEDFMPWFYFHLPYITLGLPKTLEGAQKAERRLDWMVSFLDDDQILQDESWFTGHRMIYEWLPADFKFRREEQH